MKRIAIVNQRYGAEVNGGSEYYTKMLAEHLNKIYEVEVLTTTALDYDTWKPHYPEGVENINGVKVRRFPVEKVRSSVRFRLINKLLVSFHFLKKYLEPVWINEQGPYCPRLISYIRENRVKYDVFIFVTYLYYTTVRGLPEVAEKAILVPTAHDEYCIYFEIYKNLFLMPKAIAYLTDVEKEFVENQFYNQGIPNVVAGAGVTAHKKMDEKDKSDLSGDYIVYVGRVDTSKNCDILFEFFMDYKKSDVGGLKLIVVGKIMMKVPQRDDIVYMGFVDETEKNRIIAGALALVMPSEYESLSLSVLEAMAFGVPVIVNGNCAVLKEHCQKSGAGLWFCIQKEFDNCLNQMMKKDETYETRSMRAKDYVERNYSWDKTIAQYLNLIEERSTCRLEEQDSVRVKV